MPIYLLKRLSSLYEKNVLPAQKKDIIVINKHRAAVLKNKQ